MANLAGQRIHSGIADGANTDPRHIASLGELEGRLVFHINGNKFAFNKKFLFFGGISNHVLAGVNRTYKTALSVGHGVDDLLYPQGLVRVIVYYQVAHGQIRTAGSRKTGGYHPRNLAVVIAGKNLFQEPATHAYLFHNNIFVRVGPYGSGGIPLPLFGHSKCHLILRF